jgi:hypothetical protein
MGQIHQLILLVVMRLISVASRPLERRRGLMILLQLGYWKEMSWLVEVDY